MLWRSVYETTVARYVQLPALAAFDEGPLSRPQVLIGGFDFQAYREMSIWRRLLESEEAAFPWAQLFFLRDPTEADQELLESLVPVSLQARTKLIHDAQNHWRDLIAPDKPDQAFAAVIQGDRALIMMKGAPTEDAWDAFRIALGVDG